MAVKDLDDLDTRILEVVQHDGRITNAKLAELISLSPAATYKRLRRLEAEGFIEGYGARVNLERLGLTMMCYIHIGLQVHEEAHLERFRDKVLHMPEVLECHFVTGDYDYILKVALRGQSHLEQFILKGITHIPGVAKVNTSLVVAPVKDRAAVPVGPAAG